jgi:hypothetical protein
MDRKKTRKRKTIKLVKSLRAKALKKKTERDVRGGSPHLSEIVVTKDTDASS